MPSGNGRSSNLVLAAMIFAVAMTFIDQTIVSIAVPTIQYELKLSSTGVQWVVNGYIIALAALFAAGRTSVGHLRAPAHVHPRGHHLRRGLSHVRAHPQRQRG